MQCSHCDEEIEVDSYGDPYETDGYCDDCYHDLFEFRCCACQDSGHIDDQHKFCVVFEKCAGVNPGLYRVVSTPYFWSDMLGGELIPHALELLLIIPLQWSSGRNIYGHIIHHELANEPFGYPVGHLCGDCQRVILKPLRQLLNHIGS